MTGKASDDALDEAGREYLSDLLEINKLSHDEIASDEAEMQYAEIVEHVRVAILRAVDAIRCCKQFPDLEVNMGRELVRRRTLIALTLLCAVGAGPALADPLTPFCDLQMSQAIYLEGDTVTAISARLVNPGPDPVPVEWKVWFEVPGFPLVSVVNMGADGSLILPPGVDLDGADEMFPAFLLPRGSYEFNCRLLDPVTGELIAEDLNPFTIQNDRPLRSDLYFPDPNLGQCVASGWETFVDEITSLECPGYGISDASGIEELTAMTRLALYDNQLTAIDVSANPALTTLTLFTNQLSAINVSANTALARLLLDGNQLTAIDVSANPALWQLHLGGNQLTSINVSANTALTRLYLEGNRLTSIDISANPALARLDLTGNQLTAIDVSANTALTRLYLEDNRLTSIDISANTGLTSLTLDGNPDIPCSDIHAIHAQFPDLVFTYICTP